MQLEVSDLTQTIATLTGSSLEDVKHRALDFAGAGCGPAESLLMGFLSLSMMKSIPAGEELSRDTEGTDGSHPHLDRVWNHVDANLQSMPVNDKAMRLALEMFTK